MPFSHMLQKRACMAGRLPSMYVFLTSHNGFVCLVRALPIPISADLPPSLLTFLLQSDLLTLPFYFVDFLFTSRSLRGEGGGAASIHRLHC